jgi:hypothetical protein
MSSLSQGYPGAWCTGAYNTAKSYLMSDKSSTMYLFYSIEENNPTLQLHVVSNQAKEIGGLAAGQDFRNNILTLSAGGPSSALLLFFGSASDTQSEDQRILGYKALLYGSLGALSAVYAIQLINIYITGTKIEKTQTKSGFNFYTAPEFSSHTREMGHYNGISYTFSF